AWALAKEKPQGHTKFLRKYAAFSLLVIDEWLLDHPDDDMRAMLLELLERPTTPARRCSAPSTRRRTGTPASARESVPMRSWRGSYATTSGSTLTPRTCASTPP